MKAPTNADVLLAALDSAAAKCVDWLPVPSGRTVRLLTSDTADAVSQAVWTRVTERLEDRGIVVKCAGDSADFRLSVFPMTAGIVYERGDPAGFLRKRDIRRTAQAALAVRLEDLGNGLSRAETLRVHRTDRLPFSALDEVERDGRFFLKPARPAPGSSWRWIEPLALASAMAWIVFAFYSMRSD